MPDPSRRRRASPAATRASSGRHRAQPRKIAPSAGGGRGNPRKDRRPAKVRSDRQRSDRPARPARRRLAAGLGVLLLAMTAGAAVLLARDWSRPVYDYKGDGERDVLIEVHKGDTTAMIGERLHDAGVVATVDAFINAAYGNNKMAAIQWGFYQTRTHIPAETAVRQLTDPQHRMGLVVIPEGSQLDDTTYIGTGAVTPGIFTLISKATCVDLNGDHHCVSAADLRKAAGTAPIRSLSVPGWAAKQVAAMGSNHRRIEGLIAPGTWNVNPLGSAPEILATLISTGTASYDESGLQTTAAALDMSPYDVLVVASLVQREGRPDDYAKVARVIYNRLRGNREMLEFDSTVNYPLERREVATSDADRHRRTPWNTYVQEGLPATPICSPDAAAVAAAEVPEPGDWLYFVTVDSDGTTLFTDDYQQHLAYIERAQQNGVLESNR
ncbi:MAG TPA: endolytic transglycosylase MltG [Mycobacterium sp.]|nr:endolytic transglycosylase MltG [Mycobacterium sp.]